MTQRAILDAETDVQAAIAALVSAREWADAAQDRDAFASLAVAERDLAAAQDRLYSTVYHTAPRDA